MFQLSLRVAFVIVYDTIADKLHLGHRWDGLEITKNRILRLACLVVPVAVVFTLGIKGLSKIVVIVEYRST